jgi:hypothetical protein
MFKKNNIVFLKKPPFRVYDTNQIRIILFDTNLLSLPYIAILSVLKLNLNLKEENAESLELTPVNEKSC